jgi:DNA-binding IclR family transcriptional regulator
VRVSQTVERAIDIIEFTSAAPRTLTEVAKHLGVHRSTALRLLRTLADGGLTRRREDGRYGVGYRLAGLAELAHEQFDLRNMAHERLMTLAQLSGHTVHLAAIEDDDIVYVDKVDPVGGLRLYSQIGKQVRLHTAAVGKAILSQQPAEAVEEFLRRCDFERFTESTITTPEALLRELQVAHERGWAVDDGEMEDFLNCIAAPIRKSTGDVIAAVSITALKAKTNLAMLESKLLPELLLTAAAISKELGWQS